MTSLVPRPFALPDLVEMLEGGWPLTGHHLFRVEDFRDGGDYVLRAELPGMDPEKDVKILVQGNELTITAERTVEKHDSAHTEFSYGKFARNVRLPAGAQTDKVTARYDAGILEVRVPVQTRTDAKQVEVKISK